MSRYRVVVWDHERRKPNQYNREEWSDTLTRKHLGGPNAGLTGKERREAVRKLRDCGWDCMTIMVERETERRVKPPKAKAEEMLLW